MIVSPFVVSCILPVLYTSGFVFGFSAVYIPLSQNHVRDLKLSLCISFLLSIKTTEIPNTLHPTVLYLQILDLKEILRLKYAIISAKQFS